LHKKIGIIGCGTVVQTSYIQILPKIKGIKIESVCDLNENNAKLVAKRLNCKVTSLDDLLNSSVFVLIATPPDSHYQLIKSSLEKGVHTICEKPLVTKKSEAEELIKITKDTGVKLYTTHFRRCFPSIELAQELIKTNTLGTLKEINIIEGNRFTWQTKSNYILTNKYGGVLYDTGSHTVDMALFIAGIDKLNCDLEILEIEKDKQEPSHEVQAKFMLETKKHQPICCRLLLSRYRDLANKIRLIFENGTLEIDTRLQNKIRLIGPNGSAILYTYKEYKNAGDCIAMLYHNIFNSRNDYIFNAERFINLVSILDRLATTN
jgi:predicted dehydrogenase